MRENRETKSSRRQSCLVEPGILLSCEGFTLKIKETSPIKHAHYDIKKLVFFFLFVKTKIHHSKVKYTRASYFKQIPPSTNIIICMCGWARDSKPTALCWAGWRNHSMGFRSNLSLIQLFNFLKTTELRPPSLFQFYFI